MDGFASKVRYSLAFVGSSVLAADACGAGTIASGDGRSVTSGAGLRASYSSTPTNSLQFGLQVQI